MDTIGEKAVGGRAAASDCRDRVRLPVSAMPSKRNVQDKNARNESPGTKNLGKRLGTRIQEQNAQQQNVQKRGPARHELALAPSFSTNVRRVHMPQEMHLEHEMMT
jgi:hypothetical protein